METFTLNGGAVTLLIVFVAVIGGFIGGAIAFWAFRAESREKE